MAPIKRPRADTNDNVDSSRLDDPRSISHKDTVSTLVTAPCHALSIDQRKRARVSVSGSYGEASLVRSDRSEDEEHSDVVQEEEDQTGDYERRRDAGFRDLADEDLDTMRATQIIRQKNRRVMDNMPAENAIIESVTCINFMCHTKLHVTLGPLINFIIGHNGSGKSAVLTAITLCLGGKATSTNRGQSLKSFVKEGQE